MTRTAKLSDERPTGEPDAGKPPVRFGGRGSATQCAVPTPIQSAIPLTPITIYQLRKPSRAPINSGLLITTPASRLRRRMLFFMQFLQRRLVFCPADLIPFGA